MKKLFAPLEVDRGENRAPVTPSSASLYRDLGIAVLAEPGIGERSGYRREEYEAAGVRFVEDRAAALAEADLVVRVRPPPVEEIAAMKRGALHLSFLDPFARPELVEAAVKAGVAAVSLQMLPRTTLAQKMDALSSQANLAGYAAVVMAAERLPRVLPMMMTPAGTISPSRFFIIGVGVAGLQAIATAKRLGARVDAFDTRPTVESDVRSLGARFLKVDLGKTGQTEQGYARELTQEQLARQREAMVRACAQADVVITAAKVFGRRSPILLTRETLARMRPGSLVVDLAVEAGGNVEGIVPGQETTTENGVHLIGQTCLEGRVAYHATQMYSANLYNWIEHFWNRETGDLSLDLKDEILRGCLLTRDGRLLQERLGGQRSQG